MFFFVPAGLIGVVERANQWHDDIVVRIAAGKLECGSLPYNLAERGTHLSCTTSKFFVRQPEQCRKWYLRKTFAHLDRYIAVSDVMNLRKIRCVWLCRGFEEDKR